MSFIRDLKRQLWPSFKPRKNKGRRLINPYQLPDAAPEESALMNAGIARSPDDARALIRRYTSALDALRFVPRQRAHTSFNERVRILIQRVEGHDRRSLKSIYGSPAADQHIRIQYRYRPRK